MITFHNDIPVEQTMIFEEVYEKELQNDLDEKFDLLTEAGDLAVYMKVDNRLVGEIIGCHLGNLNEKIEDCAEISNSAIYCYSTTILPPFQGNGLAKILKAYWLGICKMRFIEMYSAKALIVGHSTSAAMKHINEEFGAKHIIEHKNWYRTNRIAWFYELKL